MQQFQSIIVNFKGGIVSPGQLRDILNIASESLVASARFGLRQQLILNVPVKKMPVFEMRCKEKGVVFYKEDALQPNIVSSYCTAQIFSSVSWLSEGVYKDVFDHFDYQPSLKINVCDGSQSLVPFYSGHINWVSSGHLHFWQLSLRMPGSSEIYHCNDLVYTNDIARVSSALEQLIMNEKFNSVPELLLQLRKNISWISKSVTAQVTLPEFHLPYYEGFNKEGDTSWLGIYRRDQLFPVEFLKDVCDICLETKIGQFYTTSWKSIIIKGITEKHRYLWDQALGSYRINVRHAANELNWRVEDNNEDGLILKRHIIRHFDVEDVRTYGLSFAVKTRSSTSIFGSVIIRKQPKKNSSRLKSSDRFEILHTRDFNPNTNDHISFRKDVEKDQLGTYLVSLCKIYYEHLRANNMGRQLADKITARVMSETPISRSIYQCSQCLSVYDEQVGEAESNIPAGTSFNALPVGYACPLCEAGKELFVEISAASLVVG